MAVIQVAKADIPKIKKRELYATICYHYGYTLPYVQDMPARDLYLLYKVANKIEAARMYSLTNIAAAPHSKKGQSVKKLLSYYKEMVNK